MINILVDGKNTFRAWDPLLNYWDWVFQCKAVPKNFLQPFYCRKLSPKLTSDSFRIGKIFTAFFSIMFPLASVPSPLELDNLYLEDS
jgi:hypothetical protein